MTVQVWKVLAWRRTFQLPQQAVIIRIASQGAFTKGSSFQIVCLHLKQSTIVANKCEEH